MIANAPPSRDPTNEGTFSGMFKAILRKFLQNDIDTMLPAVVISYDRASNTAIVKPTIQMLDTNGNAISREQIAKVKVLALGGGGFVLNFPLQAGSKGWIEACDRDISLFAQAGNEEQPPNTLRFHSFSDSRFIPDIFSQYVISPSDEGAMVLQSTDGSVAVVVDAAELRLRAPSVKVVSSGNTAITSAGTLTITASATTINGPVTAPNGITIGSIPFGSHRHTGVTLGTGTSGGPTT